MRLWLSLVGIPRYDAPVEYTTIEKREAESATSAVSVSPPKSTIFEMVDATLAFICVMMNTPRKLNTALIIMALRVDRQRVVIHVAIALGASVQPLTKITESVSTTDTRSIGDDMISETKYENDTSMLPTCYNYFTSILPSFHDKE